MYVEPRPASLKFEILGFKIAKRGKNVWTDEGEVLVFDAVEPQMTFIISLAGAIVERRGGMLVHSSIIAREMNIPAVNGVPKATSLIQTGDFITVNGDLGIVVIGKPEFEIELGR